MATAPMTMTAGDSMDSVARRPNVVRQVRCSGRVPQVIAATGVSAGSPPAMSRSAISVRLATPMRTATVPPRRPTASQSTGTPASPS